MRFLVLLLISTALFAADSKEEKNALLDSLVRMQPKAIEEASSVLENQVLVITQKMDEAKQALVQLVAIEQNSGSLEGFYRDDMRTQALDAFALNYLTALALVEKQGNLLEVHSELERSTAGKWFVMMISGIVMMIPPNNSLLPVLVAPGVMGILGELMGYAESRGKGWGGAMGPISGFFNLIRMRLQLRSHDSKNVKAFSNALADMKVLLLDTKVGQSFFQLFEDSTKKLCPIINQKLLTAKN